MPLLLAVICPLAISWLLTGALVRWAPQWRLVDYPDPRKVHTRPTPRAGGLAIYLASIVGVALLAVNGGAGAFTWGLLLVGLGIVVLGLIDDIRPLTWQLRLGVQAVVAVVAALWLLPPTDFLQATMAVIWIIGLVNAFNMLDNMDALSSGVAWIAAGYLALMGLIAPADHPAASEWPFYFIVMAAITGFLMWNWPPARIFMGDCGSTFLGLLIGVGTARIALQPRSPLVGTAEVPYWMQAVVGWSMATAVAGAAWYDLITVVSVRLSQGRSPFHADKQHLSHRLVARGLSSPVAVRLIHWMALASGTSGLILCFVPSLPGAAIVIAQCLAWWLALAGIEFLGVKRTETVATGGSPVERGTAGRAVPTQKGDCHDSAT
jgi:UDP-GlcNAc:undecaprenyl-phosphate GlcNAc-1-phosphate transferase